MDCGDSSCRRAVSIGVHAAIAVGWSVVEVGAERLGRSTVLAFRRALMRATDLREGGCLRPGEVLLPRHILHTFTGDVAAVAQQPVAQPTMQRLGVLGQSAMQLTHPDHRWLPRGATPPHAPTRRVEAITAEAGQ